MLQYSPNEIVIHAHDGGACLARTPFDRATMRRLLGAVKTAAGRETGTLHLEAVRGGTLPVNLADIKALELKPSFAVYPDFLEPGEASEAGAWILSAGARFEQSLITNTDTVADPRVRRSHVLRDISGLPPTLVDRIADLLPAIAVRFGMADIPLRQLECEATAHADGDHFAIHSDDGFPAIAHRLISFVYYIHEEPKAFEGGELRFYNSLLQEGGRSHGSHAVDYVPVRNALLVFPSHTYHEVAPVRCPSARHEDRRLTINGWVSR